MATSTQLLNGLIAGYTDLKAYFEGVRASIDAKVATLTSSLEVSYYVDATYGDDFAVGGEAAPLKTMEEALTRIPAGFNATLFLKRPAQLNAKVTTYARTILIRPTTGVSPTLEIGWHERDDGLWYPGQIDFGGVAGAVLFNEMRVTFLARDVGTRGNAYACGLISTNSLTPPAFVGFAGSAIYREAGADAYLLSASINSGDINISSDTIYGSYMDGFWCAGVAAGTAASATRYSTNLGTL